MEERAQAKGNRVNSHDAQNSRNTNYKHNHLLKS